MINKDIILADLNEILFEQREKSYGAYVLRRDQNKYLAQAFFATLSVLVVFVMAFHINKGGPSMGAVPFVSEIVDDPFEKMTTPPVIPDEPEKPEPPAEPANTPPPADPTSPVEDPPANGTDETKVDHINAVKDKDADPTKRVVANADIKGNPSDRDKKGDENGMLGNPADTTGSGTGVKTPEKPCLDCPGGNGSGSIDPFKPFLGTEPVPMNLGDLKKRIRYPDPLREIGEPGNVLFRILVDENGKYVKHITIRSTHKLFEFACLEEIKKLKFTPGKQGDIAVPVWVTIPFKFRLH